jgi:hypothetical protein
MRMDRLLSTFQNFIAITVPQSARGKTGGGNQLREETKV